MKIVVKNGKVVSMSASGDIRQQLTDISAVMRALRRYAREMRTASDMMLNKDSGHDEHELEPVCEEAFEIGFFDKPEAKAKAPAEPKPTKSKGGAKA